MSRPQGHSAAARNMSMKNSYDTIKNRDRDLPACSTVRHRVPETNHVNISVLSHVCLHYTNIISPNAFVAKTTSILSLDYGWLETDTQRRD